MRAIAETLIAAALAASVSACAAMEEPEEALVEREWEASTEPADVARAVDDQVPELGKGPVVVSADDLQGGPISNWFGGVHVTQDDGFTYGGWVDGNGPDAYEAYADCGLWVSRGLQRWAGDRRQSHAYCPEGIVGGRGFNLYER
jgi:hypothetical protein